MRRKFANLFVILLLLILFSRILEDSVKAGPPTMPSSFYGAASQNGFDLPDGTSISAWIDSIQFAQTSSFSFGGQSVYSMDVPADDPSTPAVIEGGIEGDVIVFKIEGFQSDQTGIWHGGSNQELNLSITIVLETIYLPVIINDYRLQEKYKLL